MDMKVESIRHDRSMRWPPLFSGGFRPFFLGGALWALIVVGLWVGALTGSVELPSAFDPLAWHRHEMLFGYLGAVIAGFLLTAIPNWTGRTPIAGGRLAALAGLWLLGRLAVLFSGSFGAMTALALDVGFLLVLSAVCAHEVLAARNRNVPIVVVILLFAAASALDHGEALGASVPSGIGWRLGFALVLLLISLIGGRIIPAFTRNWLTKQCRKNGLPAEPGLIDTLALAATAIALASWAIAPDAQWTAVLLLITAAVQTIRLSRWAGHKTLRDPLVLILHVSYAWLPLGLLLLGTSTFVPSVPATVGLHALGAGAMASMTLAVMTRATRGHTGRPLQADIWTVLIYVLVSVGASLRVTAPWLPLDYLLSIRIAGAFWSGAFLLFVFAYRAMLLGARPDGRP